MAMQVKSISLSEKETEALALVVLDKLKDQNVIALIGNLGSGKTTFTHGLAFALGVKKRVTSPTFVLMRRYDLKLKTQKSKVENTKKFRELYHFDLYRLQGLADIKDLGIEEIWQEKRNLVVIEWAEKIKSLLPKNTVWINFQYMGKDKRKISMVG